MAGLWLAVLAVLGAVLGPRQAASTRERVGASLGATVAIGSSDLALVRGRLTLQDLAIQRDDGIGHLAIGVREVRCELAPLGWALIDRDCGELAVRGVRFEVSSTALFKLAPPRSAPIHADRVVIDDAVFVFEPNAFAPNLGRIEIGIEHAVAGRTVMRTPLSWLFALQELSARFALPAGIMLHVTYRDGVLTAAGSLFGSRPVAIPVTLPIAEAAHDAHEEIQLLLATGKDIATRLVAKRANDWLDAKLR